VLVYADRIIPGSRDYNLSAYTINGQPVRSLNLGTGIDGWCTWQSTHGFDYVAVGTTKGEVLVAEVFYLEAMAPVHKSPNRIVGISFVSESSQIVVVSDSGNVAVVPFDAV
jgi:hypothetical protein